MLWKYTDLFLFFLSKHKSTNGADGTYHQPPTQNQLMARHPTRWLFNMSFISIRVFVTYQYRHMISLHQVPWSWTINGSLRSDCPAHHYSLQVKHCSNQVALFCRTCSHPCCCNDTVNWSEENGDPCFWPWLWIPAADMGGLERLGWNHVSSLLSYCTFSSIWLSPTPKLCTSERTSCYGSYSNAGQCSELGLFAAGDGVLVLPTIKL